MKPALLLAAGTLAAPFLAFQPPALALPGDTEEGVKARFENHKLFSPLEDDDSYAFGGPEFSALGKAGTVTLHLWVTTGADGKVEEERVAYSLNNQKDNPFRFARKDRGGLTFLRVVYDQALADDFAASKPVFAFNDKEYKVVGALLMGARYLYKTERNEGVESVITLYPKSAVSAELKQMNERKGKWAVTDFTNF